MTRLTEMALIAQVATLGSHRAFGQLVESHQAVVRRFLRRLTGGDEMLADDLAQETFIRAWRGIKGFRGGSSFQTWVMRIAYRVFLDSAKPKTAARTASADALPGDGEGAESGEAAPSVVGDGRLYAAGRAGNEPATDSAEASFALRHDLNLALLSLSEAERTCIVLQYTEGRSIREMSQITGMNENTVKSHLLRGKRNLAEYLRKHGYEGR